MSDHDDVEELALYVRIPTEEDAGGDLGPEDPLPQPNLVVGAGQIMDMAPDALTAISAMGKSREWAEDKNPVVAIEHFILSMRCGIYPNPSVLEWLAAGFQEWHANQGREGLDQCLGLKGKGGHTANVFSRTHREDVIRGLVAHIQVLRYGFDLDLRTCLSIVSAWTGDHEWYTGSHKLRQPIPDENLLRKYWKKATWAREPDEVADIKARYADEAVREAFIHLFPTDCWRYYPQLKKYL